MDQQPRRCAGLVATPGDIRMIAARSQVPDTMLQPLASSMTDSDYTSSTQRHSHMLRFGLAYPVYGASGGKLINVKLLQLSAQNTTFRRQED